MYKKVLNNGFIIQNTEAQHASGLEALQQKVFPTLSPEELMSAAHYLEHIRLFPEGQFVILDGEKVIGMTTTMRYHLSLEPHTFLEISGNLWMTTHEPESDWLYGLDVGIDPDYRGMGLARELYRARQKLGQRLGLKGQITVGMMNGYADMSDQLTTDEYYEKLKSGEINDPTVSMQQRMGFEIRGLIHDYLDDPQCGHCGVLLTVDSEVEI